jgi:hypothetical protein
MKKQKPRMGGSEKTKGHATNVANLRRISTPTSFPSPNHLPVM